MPQNAWSLLAFTILAQMSVGAYCVAEFINFSYTKEFGFESLHPLRLFFRIFVLAVAILAGVSSLFHLKNWSQAYHAFDNLKTSWVSKEMALFLLFISCVALLALLSWRKTEVKLLRCIITIAGGFFGIALIFSMAKIYMLPTIPVWNAWTTPGLFFTAALLLGALVVIGLYTTFLESSKSSSLMETIRERWRRKSLPNLIKVSMFFLVMGILISGSFAYRLMAVEKEYGAESSFISSDKQKLFLIRILLFLLGWILLMFHMKKSRLEEGILERSPKLVFGAFIFITLAEIVGRYLFYVSFYRIGL